VAVLHRRPRPHGFGSHGRERTNEFNAGDVGYVPQGYGHYIENAGTDDLDLLIVLNNGEYQSISLSAWLAANPRLLLSTNFKVPESTFASFPTRERFMPG
jgi:oxalate decarboxylase